MIIFLGRFEIQNVLPKLYRIDISKTYDALFLNRLSNMKLIWVPPQSLFFAIMSLAYFTLLVSESNMAEILKFTVFIEFDFVAVNLVYFNNATRLAVESIRFQFHVL